MAYTRLMDLTRQVWKSILLMIIGEVNKLNFTGAIF